MIISKIHVIPFGLFLLRHDGYEFDGLHRAGFHAGLLAAGPSLFIPVRTVYAQIAFGGFPSPLDFDPDSPVGLLRAHFKAGLAADTFFAVDSSNITVFNINEGGSDRTILDADRYLTLPAGRNLDIVGEFAERILHDLNA